MKIQKGDKVLILVGKDRNKTGLVEKVLPKIGKIVVAGVNVVKKHLKKSQKYPQGGIIDITAPIQISNVMLLDPHKNKPTRIGFRITGSTKVRYAKLSGETISKEAKK